MQTLIKRHIGGELNLRIPSGRYGALWHKEMDVSKLKKEEIPFNVNTLNLYNNFVAQGRAVLIHSGNSPKNSDGCLLINQNLIFKDKAQTIEVDNILKSGKKEILAQHIKDKFTKAILGKTIAKEKEIKEFVRNNIEVRIENGVGIERKSIEIARLKAFMYALRYGEGTLGAKGYKTIVGGGNFEDFSKHPNVYIKKFNSTAAGAYQFLSTTWNSIVSQYGERYNINDFSPKNQDKACLVLLYKIRESVNLITENKIDEAIRSRTDKPKKRLHYEWASLPDSPYGQRTEKMEDFMKCYNKHLEEELQGISNLAISNEEIVEFLQLLRGQK